MMEEQEQKKKEKEPIREASEEVSHEFKTLIDPQHLNSLNQMQNLLYATDLFLFILYY